MEDIDMPDAPFQDFEPEPSSSTFPSSPSSPHSPDVRSPRTPTYIPSSPSITLATPFDITTLTPTLTLSPTRTHTHASKRLSLPAPPSKPQAWVWQCHLCRTRYPLGVTRRCLIDGHYYCSGEGTQPNIKKRQKVQSCSSEFDYGGWREWGEWRRRVLAKLDNPKVDPHGRVGRRGCEQCDFPSQCRYGESEQTLEQQPSQKVLEKATVRSELKVDTGVKSDGRREGDGKSRYYDGEKEGVALKQALLAKAASAATNAVSEDKKDSQTALKRTTSTTKKKRTVKDDVNRREFNMQELVFPVLDMWTGKAVRR